MKTPKELFRSAENYRNGGYSIETICDILETEFDRDARRLEEEDDISKDAINKLLQKRWDMLNRIFKKEWGFEPLPKSRL